MAPRSRQSPAAAKTSGLKPVLTLEGHTEFGPSISYFPDSKRMISGSRDGTTRRWDLVAGKEIEEARNVGMREVDAVAVSRDGRWVVVGGGNTFSGIGELRVCEVETGIVRKFQGHSGRISCIDISTDSTLLASGANDLTVRIWRLDTGKLVADLPINTWVGAVRFSQDSKKIVVISNGRPGCLGVWDVQTQNRVVTLALGKHSFSLQNQFVTLGKHSFSIHRSPAFWTTEDKSIVTAFSFTNFDYANTIYEFDASTLKTVGTPFKGHTNTIDGLALSFEYCALLASASRDDTIKLWAFESRQLLASFHIQNPRIIIFSPNSCQLAYTTWYNTSIYVCNTPLEVLESIQPTQLEQVPQRIPPPTRKISPVIGSRLPQPYPHPREPLPSSPRNDEPDDLPPEAMLQDLTKYITKDGDYPVARGGFGEIWKCTYHNDQRSIKVAVKALQVYAADQVGAAKMKKIKRITRELRICANIKHKNILPVYGYTYGFGPFIAIVSPWAENGNLTAYLECVGADLTVLRRFQILRDIIIGLQYLHANNVIHGDFNGPNVLIHGDGTACIADFGLSLMYSEVISAAQASWTSTLKGNARWMAPELLEDREDGSQVRPSEQSDMYSFGGIMLQVLTNKIPYYHLSNDAAIVLCIAKSQTPSRSRYPMLPETCWQFIEKCWSTDPRDRPSTKGADGVIRKEYDALSNLELFSIQSPVTLQRNRQHDA